MFRQPQNIEQLSNVFIASYIDPFQNYGIDENENWTLELIKEWWLKKDKFISFLETPNMDLENNGQNKLYINYLNENAEFNSSSVRMETSLTGGVLISNTITLSCWLTLTFLKSDFSMILVDCPFSCDTALFL